MTTHNEKSPATAPTVNEGNELGKRSTPQPTSLQQALNNALLELILDQRFTDRNELIQVKNISFADVEEICKRFDIPVEQVLDLVKTEVES